MYSRYVLFLKLNKIFLWTSLQFILLVKFKISNIYFFRKRWRCSPMSWNRGLVRLLCSMHGRSHSKHWSDLHLYRWPSAEIWIKSSALHVWQFFFLIKYLSCFSNSAFWSVSLLDYFLCFSFVISQLPLVNQWPFHVHVYKRTNL